MDNQTALQVAEELLKDNYASEMVRKDDLRLDVLLSPEQLHDAIRVVHESRWGYLSAIAGIDHPPAAEEDQSETSTATKTEGEIEVLYVFFQGAATLVLRVKVPYSHAELPTICDVIPSATLYERELKEMFGVEIRGTPVQDRLLLPDIWPEGVFPLRKAAVLDNIRSGLKE